jgi:hypothetical protein
MSIFSIILVVLGLGLFETVSSVDNAIINAEVLGTMQPRARKWFLHWGMLFAVFAVRGLLPWLIVWLSTPNLGPWEAITAAFTSDQRVIAAVAHSAPLFLMAGAVFLILLFFHWLFLEPKNYGLAAEKFFYSKGVWFYAIISLILCLIVWQSLKVNPVLGFAAIVGSTAFFITHGFKESAARQETLLMKSGVSDISKLFYLEVIDMTFSIDGVLGAFAFTLSVPLILLGNSLGAFIVRKITISNIQNIKKYVFLKNGAMYSLLFLGLIMLLDAFGWRIPPWVSPFSTFTVVGYFFLKSKAKLRLQN